MHIPIHYDNANFSLKRRVLYLSNSYLSWDGTYGTITKSTKLNGHTYHLLALHQNSRSSLLLTTLKVISYCSLILPLLAYLTRNLTTDPKEVFLIPHNSSRSDCQYNSSRSDQSYVDRFIHRVMNDHVPLEFIASEDEENAIYQLDPNIFYKRGSLGKPVLFLVLLSKNATSITKMRDKLTKDLSASFSKKDYVDLCLLQSDPELLLLIIKKINPLHQEGIGRYLTKSDLRAILLSNPNIYEFLYSPDNSRPLPEKLLTTELGDIEFYATHLTVPICQQQLSNISQQQPNLFNQYKIGNLTPFMHYFKHLPYSYAGYPTDLPETVLSDLIKKLPETTNMEILENNDNDMKILEKLGNDNDTITPMIWFMQNNPRKAADEILQYLQTDCTPTEWHNGWSVLKIMTQARVIKALDRLSNRQISQAWDALPENEKRRLLEYFRENSPELFIYFNTQSSEKPVKQACLHFYHEHLKLIL